MTPNPQSKSLSIAYGCLQSTHALFIISFQFLMSDRTFRIPQTFRKDIQSFLKKALKDCTTSERKAFTDMWCKFSLVAECSLSSPCRFALAQKIDRVEIKIHYHVQPLVYAVTFVVCFPLERNFPSSTEVLLPMISKFILGWIVSLGFVFLANHGHGILKPS